MYRTMEMRVEPKLSYTETLITSGSKRKVWFGYSLYALQSIGSWIKENLVSGILKLLCFLAIISAIIGALVGVAWLVTWLLGVKAILYAIWGLVGLAFFAVFGTIAKEISEIILRDFRVGKRRIREEAFSKLGQQSATLGYEITSPTQVDIQFLKSRVEEIQSEIEEANQLIFKELKNV